MRIVYDLTACALTKHYRDTRHPSRGGEMFERVAADEMTDVENARIGDLKNLGDAVCRESREEIAATAVSRRVERHQQQNGDQRSELNDDVWAKIAGPGPVKNTECAQQHQRNEKELADIVTDSFRDHV